jgi:hypothetical protein
MEKQTVNCPNCEQEYEEGFQFCPHCGQKANEDLTIGVLFYNTISNYFSFDARFFKSFIPLMIKPGYLAKKFIGGKRLLFLHPAQMYLFISVVFFFLFSFVTRKQAENLNNELKKTRQTVAVIDSVQKIKTDSIEIEKLKQTLKNNKFIPGINDKKVAEIDSILKKEGIKKNEFSLGFNEKEIDSLINTGATDDELYEKMGLKADDGGLKRKLYAQMLKFYKARDGGTILKTFYDTIPIALFFLLPIFAFILKILYYKKGLYAHHLVFSFYFFSFLFTVFSFLVLAVLIWDDFPSWMTAIVMLSTFVYLFIALKHFYGQGWFLSFFKSGVTTFLFLLFVIPLAAVIVGVFAFMFY